MNSKKLASLMGEGWSPLIAGDRPGAYKGYVQVILRDATDRPYLATIANKEGIVFWIAYGTTPDQAVEAARFKAEADIRSRQEALMAILDNPEGERPSPDAALLR